MGVLSRLPDSLASDAIERPESRLCRFLVRLYQPRGRISLGADGIWYDPIRSWRLLGLRRQRVATWAEVTLVRLSVGIGCDITVYGSNRQARWIGSGPSRERWESELAQLGWTSHSRASYPMPASTSGTARSRTGRCSAPE